MRVLVSGSPDVTNGGKVLAKYRLSVNGALVGIGPGRGTKQESEGSGAVYDVIDVPPHLLTDVVSVALQCYHDTGGAGAWAMLEAQAVDEAGHMLAHIRTAEADWLSYNADSIFRDGVADSGSAYQRVNEDIDARELQKVADWRSVAYEPTTAAGWREAQERTPEAPPLRKQTLPLSVTGGARPVELLQLAHGHYFFDFGVEQMAGLALAVPAATARAWGGAGARVEVRLSEQLAHFSKHEVLVAGNVLDPGNWNKIPKWISIFTLTDGDSHFEHHEYVGLFRYGEIRVKGPVQEDPGPDGFELTRWSVSYPWHNEAFFNSSDDMLNRVWKLCADTIKHTSLDTFTDSNVRERTPYEADGYLTSLSYWALKSDREWPRHSTQYILSNPTWPTEWKHYAVFLVHGHWMQTGDASLADNHFDQLVNQTMLPFIDASDLVNFTIWRLPPQGGEGSCPFHGLTVFGCNSPMCHDDSPMGRQGKSCDNIDWLPKFRAGYHFSNVSTIINAFSVRAMEMLAELADATGRGVWSNRLAAQASRTRDAMLERMYRPDGLWCDGVCSLTDKATFHSQHYPLYLGITPKVGVAAALGYLAKRGMVGSTYSASSLLHGLYERASALDYGQTALELLTQCGAHSWCHMLRNGATLAWEHWWQHDGTHSHPWAASPAAAIASGLMGLRPQAPGWTKWTAKPAPGRLTSAAITVPTPRGPISAEFTRGEALSLTVTIPEGTEASLCMPLFSAPARDAYVTLDGETPAVRVADDGAFVCVDNVRAAPGRMRVLSVASATRSQLEEYVESV